MFALLWKTPRNTRIWPRSCLPPLRTQAIRSNRLKIVSLLWQRLPILNGQQISVKPDAFEEETCFGFEP